MEFLLSKLLCFLFFNEVNVINFYDGKDLYPHQILSYFPIPWMGVRASQAALVVKNLPTSAGDVRDVGLIPGSGRSPGGGHGDPLQYLCLENPMDRGAWRAAVLRVAKSQTQWRDLAGLPWTIFVLFSYSTLVCNFKCYSFKVKPQLLSLSLRQLHFSLYFLARKSWKEGGSVSSSQPQWCL